ncbi:MAG: HAMP domain-containing histidine kinase [Betaproteobacteria bacterium]|nr:HAMP domain-containing histidine kinase [Betaproteobacteria bacterium]
MNETTLGLQRRLIGSHPQWWLGAMLLALHYALAWGIDDWSARAMLLAHFGLFLMWQPVWRGERSIESRHAYLVVIVGLLLAGWNNWWLMAVWLAVLFALIGGNLLGSQQPRQRLAAILAALYLLSLLLIWVVPHLFADQRFEPALVILVQYGLQLLPILIIVVPIPAGSKSSPLAVDLFYSLMLFLLVTGLVLGSFVVKQVSHGDYPLALAQSLIVMALLLLTLSWLWNPRGGFMGLGHQLSRYLMSLGLPFERWVKGLADLAEREREPSRFLSLALHNMCELPWVAGLAWQAPHSSGEIGMRSRFQTGYSFKDLTLTFHTKWSLSPALLLHLKLLTQMLGHFYEAKQREEAQRHNAYTQAIHETGARLTHDVKNLLQSLTSLCAVAENSGADQAAALQELMKRQLPQITQRLSTTLEKLRGPPQAAAAQVDAAAWLEGLKQRYPRSEIEFIVDGAPAGATLPQELFDSVAENLLQNAIAKSQQHAGMRISVTVRPAAGGRLTICDSGKAMPKAVAARLFSAPVPSQNGLGIGLYQAAKQAQQSGYKLELVSNSDGRVCFELARTSGLG